MRCQRQTLKAVWNRSVGAEYMTGCSPVLPAFFPGLTDSLKLYSGITVCRACRSPVVCSLVLPSALVTEPMILLGWQFRKFSLLIAVSHGTWMLFFFLGHGLCIFWVSDTELDQSCLTNALSKKLDCK